MEPKSNYKWLLFMSGVIFISTLGLLEKELPSQLKRDESTAKEAQKINPLTPVVDVTGKVIDNTVNQVLPFDISTESQLVKHEEECYRSCEKEKEEGLKMSKSEAERGYMWRAHYKCKEGCPIEAAQKTEEGQRAPTGSAHEYIKSR